MGILDFIRGQFSANRATTAATYSLRAADTVADVKAVFDSLPADVQADDTVQRVANRRIAEINAAKDRTFDPLSALIGGALDAWLIKLQSYDLKDPAKAKESLTELTKYAVEVSGAALAVQLTAAMLPNDAGKVASDNVGRMMAWLGFGAVVTAVAHDPVKIGMLRPYQDSLEATFRNKRPGDIALFQAYRTRELSPVKIEDLSKLTDAEMTRIEADNEAVYFREIAKWGYSEWFATALSRSATRTLGFSQLVTLARAGIYDKGLAIYSLWGEGLDRVVMPAALTAIETLRDREMYSGFRSMIEPSYTEGDISEADLVAYWKLSGVPDTVRDWVLPRLRKKREAYALKLETGAAVRERDLTVSQVQQAYQNLLMDRAHAQNMILALGYSLDETKVILDLAELRRKLPAAATLKRLPLTDYEKAFKAKLISQDAVLARMAGEYAKEDIALEKKLLEAGKA